MYKIEQSAIAKYRFPLRIVMGGYLAFRKKYERYPSVLTINEEKFKDLLDTAWSSSYVKGAWLEEGFEDSCTEYSRLIKQKVIVFWVPGKQAVMRVEVVPDFRGYGLE